MGTIIHFCELMYPKLKVLVMLLCSEDPVTYLSCSVVLIFCLVTQINNRGSEGETHEVNSFLYYKEDHFLL